LHNLILEYFNKNFDTKLHTGIVHPQRHPFGNGYLMNAFIRPKEGASIETTLKNVLLDLETDNAINNQTLTSFDFVFSGNLDKTY